MSLTLIHNAIIGGKYFTAGDPLPCKPEELPANMKKYISRSQKIRTEPQERNILQQYNRRYSVSEDGFPMPTVGRQAAQMKAEIEQQEFLEEQQAAEAKLSPEVEAALDEARDDYQADVEVQKRSMEYQAKVRDEIDKVVAEEQDANVASGAFDQMDSDSFREVSNGDSVNAKPKRSPQSFNLIKSYVRRGPNTFVGANTVKLIPGEPLFRHRQKSFGVAEKFIRYSTVKKGS